MILDARRSLAVCLICELHFQATQMGQPKYLSYEKGRQANIIRQRATVAERACTHWDLRSKQDPWQKRWDMNCSFLKSLLTHREGWAVTLEIEVRHMLQQASDKINYLEEEVLQRRYRAAKLSRSCLFMEHATPLGVAKDWFRTCAAPAMRY
jgi:hypothetical protein